MLYMYYGNVTSITLKNSVDVHNPIPSDLLLMTGSLQPLEKHSGIHLIIRVESVYPQGAHIPPTPKDNLQTLPLRESGGTMYRRDLLIQFPKRPRVIRE